MAAALNNRLTSLDASLLYLEQPHALMHVGSICTFERTLDYEDLLQYVEDRLPNHVSLRLISNRLRQCDPGHVQKKGHDHKRGIAMRRTGPR